MWAGIALLIVVGMVHLIEAPEYFEDATYLGLLFLANFVETILTATGIPLTDRRGALCGSVHCDYYR